MNDVEYIITECQQLAMDHNWIFEYDPAPLYPGNITVRFVHPKNPNDIMVFKYNDLISEPRQFVREIVTTLTDKWLSSVKKEETKPKPQSYRDKLVEQIKLAGQDLIDRAESFVAEDLDLIGGFNISIDFPQDGPIEISTEMNTYCKSESYYKEWKETYDEVKTVLL